MGDLVAKCRQTPNIRRDSDSSRDIGKGYFYEYMCLTHLSRPHVHQSTGLPEFGIRTDKKKGYRVPDVQSLSSVPHKIEIYLRKGFVKNVLVGL